MPPMWAWVGVAQTEAMNLNLNMGHGAWMCLKLVENGAEKEAWNLPLEANQHTIFMAASNAVMYFLLLYHETESTLFKSDTHTIV